MCKCPITLSDERFPLYNWGGSNAPLGHGGWANTIQPYLKSVQILQCPSEPTGAVSMGATGFADYIMAPELMPETIFDYINERPVRLATESRPDESQLPEVLKLIDAWSSARECRK